MNKKEHRNLVRLNNWGFHDRDRDPAGEDYRILALGDSFVEGNQVPVENLFTYIIERTFRQQGHRVEVINAGVGGVGTAYEYLLWKEFFKGKIHVDHIVLFIYNGNDLPNNHPLLESWVNGNNTGGKVYLDSKGNVYVKRWKRSLGQRLLRALDRVSALSNTVHVGLYRLRRSNLKRNGDRKLLKNWGASKQSGSLEFAWKEAVEGTIRLLVRWHEELHVHGIKFSLVIIPQANHRKGDYGNKFKTGFVVQLKELGMKDNIAVLELDFSDYDPYDIYSFDNKTLGHFNKLGHRVTATQTLAWLKSLLTNGVS